MDNINEIIDVLWKSGHADDEMARKLMVDLPEDVTGKLVAISDLLRATDYDDLVDSSEKGWSFLDSANSCKAIDFLEIIKELLVSCYLSEHRLDEYVQGSKEFRKIALGRLTEEWGIEEEFLLKTYISWSMIKKHLS